MTHPTDTAKSDELKAGGEGRPIEPNHASSAWYRGWEIGWNDMAAKWAGTGWDAYKGGCDLGAPRIQTSEWQDCLDEIDDYEDGDA
ncbi:hypothetical protein [Sphingobium sp. HDIP04]|uniref:hypothetical protein n=1 Tax=Sphingobium sp. HDIP04 TaxID=428994 RepID=UPI000387813E|nr:hypothetical protein [Sphingobium sp. HDIP04]EQA97251.1 hypothetical protein L286_23280 [Sphingobium sp. HDIP04]